jgi:putative ABC transport system substrate-binding protein
VADLVQRQVAVIVCNQGAAIAAKAGTATVPIVFVAGGDPVQAGLVPSLQRPGGNLTGVTFFGGAQLAAKRIELLHDLVPKVGLIGVLQDPSYAGSIADVREITAAARALGLRTVVAHAATQEEFDPAFGRIVQAGAGALVVSGAALFTSRLERLVALATRHAMPVIYDQRDDVVAGGLISYSASFTGAYHQAGMYAARILKGARPGELPVLQPTTFELVINLKTAKALGLAVSPSVLARAEEVIQ